MSKVKKELREYSPEFRVETIKLMIDQGVSVAQVSKDLGVPVGTLHGWLDKVKKGKWTMDSSNLKPNRIELKSREVNQRTSSQQHYDQLSREQQRSVELERQLRRMTMERNILKKAMAFCMEIPK